MAPQTETEKVRFQYWNEFKNYLADSGSHLSVGTPRAKQNNWIKIGPSNTFRRDGSHLAASALIKPEKEIRANFVLEDRGSLPLFEALREQKDTLEEEMGATIVFEGEKNEQVRRIYVARAADFRERIDWPNQFDWLRRALLDLRSKFQSRVE